MHDTKGCGSYINLGEQLAAAECGTEDGSNGFAGVVGSSRAFRDALDQIRTVATTDSTVLIEGETGTGKEVRRERDSCPE
jgi:transcriptional regulator with GAF, ATPase, and Fis domain